MADFPDYFLARPPMALTAELEAWLDALFASVAGGAID